MKDEAMRTNDHPSWSTETRLRDRAVRFVSSSPLPATDTTATKLESAESSSSATPLFTPSSGELAQDTQDDVQRQKPADQDQKEKDTTAQSLFFEDVVGDENLRTSTPALRVRSPSPERSEHSDEEIVFKGRASRPTVQDDPIDTPIEKTRDVSSPVRSGGSHVTDALLEILGQPTELPQRPSMVDDSRSQVRVESGWAGVQPKFSQGEKKWLHADGTHGNPSADFTPKRVSIPRRVKQVRTPSGNKIGKKEAEDAILQDYIDNMSDSERLAISGRDLGGTESEWATDDTTDDEIDIDEHEPTQSGKDADMDEIGDDEDEDISDGTEVSSIDSEEGDNSDLESVLDRLERHQWEDDADLRKRHQDAMTDEQLARILEKQESLGISGDEIVLFNDTGFGDVDEARMGLDALTKSHTKKPASRKASGKQRAPIADAYDDFDIMDFERPSLQKKGGKKSRGKPDVNLDDLSDEELMDALQGSWAADRQKKRVKKSEREELRAAGLLGRKQKSNADLGQKYSEGMSILEIRDELRDFIDAEHTTKAFPPMGKEERKVLHQIAMHFNITSKSRGSGKARFIVLVKTRRTIDWSDSHWTAASRWARREFLPNSKAKGSAKASRKSAGGRGGGAAGQTYRHGEVVGAAAPELAADNFGRKLMEKMGWTTGTALGKSGEGEDQRLIVPVQAVIKSGRGGLG